MLGDIVHLVIAVWSTGDSFGHDSGAHSECFGVFKTKEEADKKCKELELDTKSPLPWLGYFENLESVETYQFSVGV